MMAWQFCTNTQNVEIFKCDLSQNGKGSHFQHLIYSPCSVFYVKYCFIRFCFYLHLTQRPKFFGTWIVCKFIVLRYGHQWEQPWLVWVTFQTRRSAVQSPAWPQVVVFPCKTLNTLALICPDMFNCMWLWRESIANFTYRMHMKNWIGEWESHI